MHWQRDIQLLSPTFCRGAYKDKPEIRVPSIRGMVRWWFRALGATPDDEKTVFGGMRNFGSNREVMASKLVFRVSNVQAQSGSFPALPHKQGGQGNPQFAFRAGGTFHLEVFSRFEPLPLNLENKAIDALEVWLLLGALGLRANRAGGSLWPTDDTAPKNEVELRLKLQQHGCKWPVYLAGPEVGTSLEQLRAAATDTVSEPKEIFGSAKRDRLASPLKFKIVKLNGVLRLLITAPSEDIITQARQFLRGHHSRPETWVRI